MIKKWLFIISISFIFLYFSLECSEEQKLSFPSQDIHVVYSHAWFEDITCKKYQYDTKKWITESCYDKVMIFNEKRTIKSSTGKDILLSDDDTTFFNSYAMKFTFLGNSMSMPSYPGEPRSWSLYSTQSVHALADHLYDRVIKEKRQKIVLVGPCVGASIAFNCLKKLVNFKENQDYFEGTSIKSADDAQAIINAINNGAFIALVPLMSIKKHNAVAMPAAMLSGLTFAAATIALYCYGDVVHNPEVAQLGLTGGGLLASCMLGGYMKNIYATIIKYGIVPLLSKFNYNPLHEDPIDNIECLKEKITCPVAFNFTKQDWVMEWQNDGLIKLHETFENHAHIIITEDTGHMQISPKFQKFLKEKFKDKCLYGNDFVMLEDGNNTQCSIDELKQKIYPWEIFSQLFGSKKWVIALTFICAFSIWLKYAHIYNSYVS